MRIVCGDHEVLEIISTQKECMVGDTGDLGAMLVGLSGDLRVYPLSFSLHET